jgi:two-component system, NarL family, nitrate/nitrite response regulator NarL
MSTELFTETAMSVECTELAPLAVTGEPVAPLAETPDERTVALPTGQSVRTVIIDNDAFFRNGIARVLASTSCQVVANCAGLHELSAGTVCDAQLIILGLDEYSVGEHSHDAREKLNWLRQVNPKIQIIVLGPYIKAEKLLQFVKGGVSCYLAKIGLSPLMLIKSVGLVLLGAAVFTGEFCDRVLKPESSIGGDDLLSIGATPASDDEGRGNQRRLSDRERVILSLLMKGAANRDIALHLGISEPTVKIHVKNLLIKIGVRNRTQAAMWALKSKMREAS